MKNLSIPNMLSKIVNIIGDKSPLQKKKINKYLSGKNEVFFKEAEKLVEQYSKYLDNQHIPLEVAVDSYLKMCKDMMNCQLHFLKTGKYSVKESLEFTDSLYKNEVAMKSYMIGLALSQFLWGNHYDMYNFLKNYIKENKDDISSFLEIGPGHGLFLNTAMEYLDKSVNFYAVDISSVAMEVTKSVIQYFRPTAKNVNYEIADMLDMQIGKRFDFITMGEVLEHVNYPFKILNKIKELLTYRGAAFVSTCINAPAIDHVYHFRSVDKIREMFKECGLVIKKELVLPVEDLPMEEIINKKITINYCAILKK